MVCTLYVVEICFIGCALAGCLVNELADGLCTHCLVSVMNCMVYWHPKLLAELFEALGEI